MFAAEWILGSCVCVRRMQMRQDECRWRQSENSSLWCELRSDIRQRSWLFFHSCHTVKVEVKTLVLKAPCWSFVFMGERRCNWFYFWWLLCCVAVLLVLVLRFYVYIYSINCVFVLLRCFQCFQFTMWCEVELQSERWLYKWERGIIGLSGYTHQGLMF